jgi:hypothetical protein
MLCSSLFETVILFLSNSIKMSRESLALLRDDNSTDFNHKGKRLEREENQILKK